MGKEKLCSLFSINSCFMHNWFYCGYISPFSFFIHSFILSSTKSFLEIQERWQIINEDHCTQEALSVEKEACEPTTISNVIVPQGIQKVVQSWDRKPILPGEFHISVFISVSWIMLCTYKSTLFLTWDLMKHIQWKHVLCNRKDFYMTQNLYKKTLPKSRTQFSASLISVVPVSNVSA